MSVAAVVVTYNRKKELIKNVRAMLSQTCTVDRFFIIDNHGSDGSREALLEAGLLDHPVVSYRYLSKNIGGAGGFYTGVKKAYEEGFDYVLLMDDDGRPADDTMLERLLLAATKLHEENNRLMLNALVKSMDEKHLAFGLTDIESHKKAQECAKDGLLSGTINPFNGTLLSRELIAAVGFPNPRFFIKGDEEDYQLRAENAGALIATVIDAIYLHPMAEKKKLRIAGKLLQESVEAPWKEYYRARNLTFLFYREQKNRLWLRHVARQCVLALRFSDRRGKTVWHILKGCAHGLMGKLGKTVQPGQ